jgi:AcrR family transcriptional regulator
MRTQNADGKIDRRIQRTRQSLEDALVALILEKGYESISVQEIAERANVNRASFYLHYKDKDDLMVKRVEATFDELALVLSPLDPRHFDEVDLQRPQQTAIFQHLADHAVFYRAMFSVPAFVERTENYIVRYTRRRIGPLLRASKQQAIPSDLMLRAIAGMLISATRWWLSQDAPAPPEQIAEQMLRLIMPGVYHSLGLDHYLERMSGW